MTQQDQHHQPVSHESYYVPSLKPGRDTLKDWHGFSTLWIASGSSYFAYWSMQLALSLFANYLTRSPLLVAGVTFALTVPSFAFSLFAGAIVDRYDRRRLLLAITTLRLIALGVATLLAWSGYITLPLLYAIALILGITQAIKEPALAATLPMVVAVKQLDRANAWLVGAQNVIELLAFPLGGVFASISATLTMGVGEGCTIVTLVALLLLRGTFYPLRKVKRHIVMEVIDGLRFLWNWHVLRTIGLMAGLINACWSAYLAILVLYAVAPGPVGLTAPGYGVLLMGSSVGGIIGVFLASVVQRRLGKRWAIGLNIIGNAVMFAAPALTTNAWIIGIAAVLGGMAGPLWTIAAASLLGRMVPTAIQGRANAAYRFLSNGLAAAGPLLGGLIAQVCGLQVAFIVCASLTILMLLPFFRVVTEEAMN